MASSFCSPSFPLSLSSVISSNLRSVHLPLTFSPNQSPFCLPLFILHLSFFLSQPHPPLCVFPLLSLPDSLSVNLPLVSLSPPPFSHVSVVRLSVRERMERGEERGGDRDQWRASRRGVAMVVVVCDPTPLRHNGLGQTDRQTAGRVTGSGVIDRCTLALAPASQGAVGGSRARNVSRDICTVPSVCSARIARLQLAAIARPHSHSFLLALCLSLSLSLSLSFTLSCSLSPSLIPSLTLIPAYPLFLSLSISVVSLLSLDPPHLENQHTTQVNINTTLIQPQPLKMHYEEITLKSI